MSHSSEKRWSDTNVLVSSACINMVEQLNYVENIYQDLLELYAFAGGTAQQLADQLFYDVWSIREVSPGVLDTEANATEVAMAQDAIDAMAALHNLYQAATNVAVAQEDRMATFRRFT